MLRSMYSGVAGLKVHQTRMDVIGNNIANVNTTAYKYQSINFSDVMYQTSQRASGATATTGGVNARQVGLGAINAAISTAIDQQGATQTTNNPFDMQISGSSFFIVNDGAGPKYTRDGSFYIDGEGNLAMQSTGYYVLGWGTQEDPDTGVLSVNKNGGLGRLALNTVEVQTYPAEATGAGTFSANIDRNDVDVTSSAGKRIQYEFYDDKGYIYTADFILKDIRTATVDKSSTGMTAIAWGALSPSAQEGYMQDPSDPGMYYQKKYNVVPGQYSLQLADITDSEGVSILDKGMGDGSKYSFAELGINFGAATYEDNPRNLNEDPARADREQAIILKFNDTTGAYEGMYTDVVYNDTNQSYQANAGATLYSQTTNRENYMNTLLTFNAEQALTTDELPANNGNARKNELIAAMGTDPTAEISRRFIEFNFSAVTNNNTDGRATIKTAKGNINSGATGRKVGTLSGIQVAQDGKITASYTNGQTRLMGQIATAQFANASGLEKQGENLYSSTMNSGDAVVMDVSEDGGKMSTGVLEMSNVDLSNEFTSMITAQRGFQANSRIITVSDTLLEELTNLKR